MNKMSRERRVPQSSAHSRFGKGSHSCLVTLTRDPSPGHFTGLRDDGEGNSCELPPRFGDKGFSVIPNPRLYRGEGSSAYVTLHNQEASPPTRPEPSALSDCAHSPMRDAAHTYHVKLTRDPSPGHFTGFPFDRAQGRLDDGEGDSRGFLTRVGAFDFSVIPNPRLHRGEGSRADVTRLGAGSSRGSQGKPFAWFGASKLAGGVLRYEETFTFS
jgi:hypothetical protein